MFLAYLKSDVESSEVNGR